MKKPLKILFLSQRFLYPMDTGGKIRTGKLLQQLNKVFDISLISNVEIEKDGEYIDRMEELCNEFYSVPWKELKKYSIKFYLNVLAKMFSRYPVTVINDYSEDIERKIVEVLENGKYDLLICDFLQPSLNFRKITGYPTILFQHNVEYVITKRHYETCRNPLIKLFWWSQWRKMFRYEMLSCQGFNGVITVSETDKNTLKDKLSAKNVFDIPTGIDTEYFTPKEDEVAKNSLVFTGAMDWFPNEDAILFFAKEILCKIKEDIPDVRLTVVGRNPSDSLLKTLKKYPEVKTVGWVKDIRPYISQSSLYIVPLRIGGGTRIKIFEAMAMGKAMISTTVGAEGLPVKNGENMIIADGAQDFAQAVVKLLKDAELRDRMGKSARDFVQKNFSWEKAAKVFADICMTIKEG